MKAKYCDACAYARTIQTLATSRLEFRPKDTGDIFYFCADHVYTFTQNWRKFGGDANSYTRTTI